MWAEWLPVTSSKKPGTPLTRDMAQARERPTRVAGAVEHKESVKVLSAVASGIGLISDHILRQLRRATPFALYGNSV